MECRFCRAIGIKRYQAPPDSALVGAQVAPRTIFRRLVGVAATTRSVVAIQSQVAIKQLPCSRSRSLARQVANGPMRQFLPDRCGCCSRPFARSNTRCCLLQFCARSKRQPGGIVRWFARTRLAQWRPSEQQPRTARKPHHHLSGRAHLNSGSPERERRPVGRKLCFRGEPNQRAGNNDGPQL